METDVEPVCELLACMAVAGHARELAQTLGRWVDAGHLEAIAVWTLDSERGPLRPLHIQGAPPPVEKWHLQPRTDSPLWRAIECGEDIPLAKPPESLANSHVAHWTVHPLEGKQGALIGVALSGHAERTPPPGWSTITGVLGPALERRLEFDACTVKAGLFDDLAALSRAGVIVATPDGQVQQYSPSLEQLTGWSLEDVRTHGWTNLVYPDPQKRSEAQQAIAALTLGSPSQGMVRELARKDGTSVQTRIYSRLHPHPSGFPPSMLGVMQDVTAEKTALRRASWEESQSQLERLAGGIAHEFNNLLAAIMGHADIIAMQTLPESVIGHAETIVQSAERGTEMSAQILAFSGAATSRPQPIHMGRLLRQVIELFTPRIPSGIELVVEIPDDLPALEVDDGLIQQVLINLFSNAIDAMGSTGTLTVTAGLAVPPNTARYRSPALNGFTEPLGHVSIRDTGTGFSTEALANLFVPFYSGKPAGHGVGLPAVRGIIGAHGGAVDAQNDNGAVVDLYLPLSRRPELDLPQLIQSSAGRGTQVWIVDDQSAVLEFSRISLEALGYRVRGFSGVDALRKAVGGTAEAPDILVVDVVMPDGGGPAVYGMIRAFGMDVPIIWTSGHAPEDVDLPEVGTFLQKPYTGRTLAQVINQALS